MVVRIDGTNGEVTCTVDNGGTPEVFTFNLDNVNDRADVTSDVTGGISFETNNFTTRGTLTLRNPADDTGLLKLNASVSMTADVATPFPAAAAPSAYQTGIMVDDSGATKWTPAGVLYAYNVTGAITASATNEKVTLLSHTWNINTRSSAITFDYINHTFSIPEGRWLFKFNASNTAGSTGQIDLQFYDETAASLIGHTMPARLSAGGYTDNSANLLVHIVYISAPNTYSIRVTNVAGSNPTLRDNFGGLILERIGGVQEPYSTSG